MGIAQSDRGDSRAAAPSASAGGTEHAGNDLAANIYVDSVWRYDGSYVCLRLLVFKLVVFFDHAAGGYGYASRQLLYP